MASRIEGAIVQQAMSLRSAGKIQLSIGLALLGMGLVGIACLCMGIFPPHNGVFFPVIGFIIGIGITGLGWSSLKDADSIERREAVRRERRARSLPLNSRRP